jgi:ferritin-like metal-binding protein YciE
LKILKSRTRNCTVSGVSFLGLALTLQKLYTEELRDLYNAENQLLKALPKMAKAASSGELKDAFEKHLEQTKGHVERLEQVFEQLAESIINPEAVRETELAGMSSDR